MLNHVTLMGRLVADPELRTTPQGISVTTMRLAVDRDFKNKQTGERETDFINVVTWRQTAEFVSRYFTKGRMAVVEGRLQVRQYTDKDGNKRTAVDVVADNVYFGDSQRREDSGSSYGGQSYGGQSYGAPSYGAPAQQPQTGYAAPAGEDQFAELADDDGDLPF